MTIVLPALRSDEIDEKVTVPSEIYEDVQLIQAVRDQKIDHVEGVTSAQAWSLGGRVD